MIERLEDSLLIGLYAGKDTTEKGNRYYLEVSMSFNGITPIGRLISLAFVLIITLGLFAVYFLK